MRLHQKTALITGGASGIGLATAEKFLKEGANVVILDINQEDIDKASKKLIEYKNRLSWFIGNVTNKSDTLNAVQHTVNCFNTIDILVNNAGITDDAQLFKMEETQWEKVIDVNLKGVFLMTQAAAIEMKKQKKGVILNASSVVSLYGNFGQTNYVATKFGVNGMTKTWAKELGRSNIRVNAVAPGFIQTEMIDKMPEKIIKQMKEKSVLSSLGKPKDIANAYSFLASDDAQFITGTVLSVDGGVVI